MHRYFYLIHIYKQGQISLQIPLYIEAVNSNDAKKKSEVIKSRLTKQFELLIPSSDPLMLVDSINASSFGFFFRALATGERVELEFIPELNVNIYQLNASQPLQRIEGLIMMSDDQSKREEYVV